MKVEDIAKYGKSQERKDEVSERYVCMYKYEYFEGSGITRQARSCDGQSLSRCE